MGIINVIVCVEGIGARHTNYDQIMYERVKKKILEDLKFIVFKQNNVTVTITNVFTQYNIIDAFHPPNWYQDGTLCDALLALKPHTGSKELRMIVRDVMKLSTGDSYKW